MTVPPLAQVLFNGKGYEFSLSPAGEIQATYVVPGGRSAGFGHPDAAILLGKLAQAVSEAGKGQP